MMLVEIGGLVDGGRTIRSAGPAEASAEWTVREFDFDSLGPFASLFLDDQNASSGGQKLFDWLFPRGAACPALDEPLYLQMRDDKLAALPWELICDANVFFARRRGMGVFRVFRGARAAATGGCAAPWPMRMVVVSGAPDPEINIDPEIRAIKRMFTPWGRSVNLNVIPNATRKLLADAIDNDTPHILHYCGHATADEFGTGLRLVGASGAAGEYDRYSATDIGSSILGDVGIVVLNACKTARAGGGGTAGPHGWPLAKAFLEGGAGAVVAMQADIRGEAALAFAEALYGGLVQHNLPLEEAVRLARLALTGANADWALPTVTFVHPPPAGGYRLFPAARPQPPAIRFEDPPDRSTRFVADAHEQRFRIARWAQAAKPVAILYGAPPGGKSHILRWSLANFAHLGHQIRYFDFAQLRPQATIVDLLRAIRDGGVDLDSDNRCVSKPAAIRVPLEPPDAFDRFNAELNRLLADGTVGDWVASPTRIVDDHRAADGNMPDQVRGKPFDDHVCMRAYEALAACAAHRPLTIALDLSSRPAALDSGTLQTFLTRIVAEEAARRRRQPHAPVRLRFIIECKDRSVLMVENVLLGQSVAPEDVELIEFQRAYSKDELIDICQEIFWYAESESVSPIAETFLKYKLKNAPAAPLGIAACQSIVRSILMSEDLGPSVNAHVQDMR